MTYCPVTADLNRHLANEAREDARAERIEALHNEYRNNANRLAEAEEWVAGSFPPSHYSDLSLALYELHNTHPDNLLGSDLLARLYRLAKVDHDAIDAQLLESAVSAVEDEE